MKFNLHDTPWLGFIHATARLLEPRLDSNELHDHDILRKRFIARAITEEVSDRSSPSRRFAKQGRHAWRARRPTVGFDSNFALTTEECPLAVRSSGLENMRGSGRIEQPPAIGALKREMLLLNGVVLVEFSRTVICNAKNLGFGTLEAARAQWKALSREGITVVFDAPEIVNLEPFAQALFYNQLSSNPSDDTKGLNLSALQEFTGHNPFAPVADRYKSNRLASDEGVPPRLSPGAISSVAFVSDRNLQSSPSCRGHSARADGWGSGGVALPFAINDGHGGADQDLRMRFAARSLTHVLAHEILIKQAEALYEYHAGSIRDAQEWQAKQNACGKFLMNWQRYLIYIKDCWSLAYGDRFIDTELVEAIQRAIVTRNAWQDVSSRIDSLVSLAKEALPDGEAGFLL